LCASLLMDTDDAVAELRFDVAMDDTTGLLSLVGEDLEPLDPPAFVGAESASFTRGRFEFGGLMGLADAIVDVLPDDDREQARAALLQTRGFIEPVLDAIGPEFYSVMRFDKPFDEDAAQSLTALAAADERVLRNTMTFFGANVGAKPRAFEGAQIFETEGFELAGAVHAGWLFIGTTPMVEDAIRSTRAGTSGLADEPRLERALETIDGVGVLSGFTDFERSLEWFYHTSEQRAEQLRAFADERNLPPDRRDALLASIDWVDALPDIEAFTEFVGDGVWAVRATPSGYRGRVLWLRPE
ncbi:MAG: hypothetical protein AAGK04_01305, partial [Planctomycetota bacterium]